MGKRDSNSNRVDDSKGNFAESNQSDVVESFDPGVANLRMIGVRGVCEFYRQSLEKIGFLATGFQKQRQDDNWRLYMVASAKELLYIHEFEQVEKQNATQAATIARAKAAVPDLTSRQQLIREEIGKHDSTIEELKAKPDQTLELAKRKQEREQLVEAERLVAWNLRLRQSEIALEPEVVECQTKLANVKQAMKALAKCPTCKSSEKVGLPSGITNPEFEIGGNRDRGWRVPCRYTLVLHCGQCNSRFSVPLGESPKPKLKKKSAAGTKIVHGPYNKNLEETENMEVVLGDESEEGF